MIFVIWIINNLDNTSTEERQEPEQQIWTKFSVALYLFLPIVGIALLWGRKDFFSKLQLQLDRRCVSVFCPSLSKREKLLKWASGQLPSTWASQSTRTLSSGIPELWKDGSLLCTLINSTIPGACSNPHRHWKKPPTHAQALTYKYLGLPPVFSENELSGDLTINQENNFVHYLHELQQAINKWPAKDDISRKFSSQYVARGMGLYTGEQYRKTTFYMYSNSITKKQLSILMYIRGPYGTKGIATIPPLNDLKGLSNINELLAGNSKYSQGKYNSSKFMQKISLDFSSFISGENQNVNDIQIYVYKESDRLKISYIPCNCGMYEINLIVDGEMLQGSPFNVNVVKNTSGIKDNFESEEEKVEEKITVVRKKIISKIIDCIDEKIIIDKTGIKRIASESDLLSDSKKQKKLFYRLSDDNFYHNYDRHFVRPEICKEETSMEANIIEENPNENVPLNNEDTTKSKEISVEIPQSVPKNDDVTFEIITNQVIETNPPKVLTNKISVELGSLDSIADITTNTSPICSNHIVPEVETPSPTLSLAEKRKHFSRQSSLNLSDTPNSSFSIISENDENSKSDDSSFEKLSVLNVLDTLKESTRDSDSQQMYSLSSTTSLPNITSLESCHENIFKTRKEYWEKISSTTTSSASLTDLNQGKKFPISNKNLFVKNCNKEKQIMKYKNDYRDVEQPKSVDTKNYCSLVDKKYKSLDSALEECTIMTLAERKRLLLRDQYEKEIIKPKKINIPKFNKQEIDSAKNIRKLEDVVPFSPVSEKIRQFDSLKRNVLPSVPEISPPKVKTIKHKEKSNNETKQAVTTEKFKSPFKKAINFFKDLENNSNKSNKANENTITPIIRRFSLNFEKKKNAYIKRSSSLNLPNVAERFAVNNVYKDVLGEGKNSFKGAPNKNGVISSLSSFYNDLSKPPNNKNNDILYQDDNIKFNLFIAKVKTKKRKSIKSLFDVNY